MDDNTAGVTRPGGSTTKVAVLVGSLRRDSINKALAEAAVANAPSGVELELYSGLERLPFYNEDIDLEPAGSEVARLRSAVEEADAVLISTPEYNGTIPAVLKNAIDWLSRPYGASAISGKPVGVLGAALAQFGGKWSHDDTSRSVGIAGGRVVEDVELHLQIATLEGRPVVDVPEVVEQLREAVAVLAEAATKASV